MRLCEEKVKSGERTEKSATTSFSRTSEYAALFELMALTVKTIMQTKQCSIYPDNRLENKYEIIL